MLVDTPPFNIPPTTPIIDLINHHHPKNNPLLQEVERRYCALAGDHQKLQQKSREQEAQLQDLKQVCLFVVCCMLSVCVCVCAGDSGWADG